jgi:hypothetical protein
MRQHGKKFISVERLEAVAIRALMGGYGKLLHHEDLPGMPARRKVVLRLDMDCESPYISELHARWSGTHGKRVKPMWLEIHSRCRKCPRCKERRAMYWRARAMTEYAHASQTIFGTLTTSPEWDAYLDARIQVELAKRGVDFARLPDIEQFRERVLFGGQEVTKYLKRLRGVARSERRVSFRYLLIAEAHDSAKTSGAKRNRPHWHVLFHETDKERPLVISGELAVTSKGEVRTDKYGNPYLADTAFLKRNWTAGHSTFLIAGSPQAATYCCKYITKDANHRIRSSFRYGSIDTEWVRPALVAPSCGADGNGGAPAKAGET